MVDVRIPERDMSDRAIVRLSAAARHDYWSLMLLSTSMRSDGSIEAEDLPMIPWGVNGSTFEELERHGLLKRMGPKAWVLTRFQATQTAAQELEAMEAVRNYERIKKARVRAKAAGMTDVEIDQKFPLLPSNSPRVVRGHTEEGQSQRQAGQDQSEAPGDDVDPKTGEVHGWATATPGQPGVFPPTPYAGERLGEAA
jgi:hypothetical protein